MNERQKKKLAKQIGNVPLWEKLKCIGGSRSDVYVRMKFDCDGDAECVYKKGDLMKLQVNSNGTIYRSSGFNSVQDSKLYASELFWRKYAGDEWYDGKEILDGVLVTEDEFEIVWKDGEPV